jgi:hypothetical protein
MLPLTKTKVKRLIYLKIKLKGLKMNDVDRRILKELDKI